LIAPALVRRYGKGTDSDATDAMVVADTVRFASPARQQQQREHRAA
jgi:hypothetical protein